MRRGLAGRAFPAFALLVNACVPYDRQSALDPAGPQAVSVHQLWRFMLIVSIVVYVLVIAALLFVVRRRRMIDNTRSTEREAGARRAVVAAVVVTALILFVQLTAALSVGSGMMHHEPAPYLSVRLTGYQWWWDIEYEDPIPANLLRAANELHIPVGRPVRVKLISRDVIHSFWVPNLGGKKDLIPGHDNETWIRADRPGIYRGQCAEFCGLEHAKMSLFVVAEPPEQFAAWVQRQRSPAPLPSDSLLARGKAVFESSRCALCHTVAATTAVGKIGPDLSHVASRLTIAAGTLRNTTANLTAWILDPQTLKPGAQMPGTALAAPDLRALVAYLETLR